MISVYRLITPKIFYDTTQRWHTLLKSTAFFLITLGIVWGLAFAPPDYQQKDAFRIIYLHVPTAFLSIALYALMGLLGIVVLVWRLKIAAVFIGAIASTGALMAFLALVTGSLWGKPMWGTWWIWDARLTSELVLLALYFAVLALKSSYTHPEKSDKALAILALIGSLDLPIIHYSVYWWNTLHQGASLSLLAKPKIAPVMLWPLLILLAGFSLYSLCAILQKVRYDLLWRERHQTWVKSVMVSR